MFYTVKRMSNIILTAILIVFLAQSIVFVVFVSKMSMVFKEFVSFLAPADATTPSPAAVVWASMCKQLVIEFKTVIMGLMSVQAKPEKRLENEVVTAALSDQSPVLAAALKAFPSLRKIFMKNPGLIDFALSKIATMGKPSREAGGSGASFASQLEKYT